MPESAALGQMKTVNLSQDAYDQGDYFFSLAAAAVNLVPLELRPKFQKRTVLARLAQLRR
jgi:hypothetical protein